MKKAIKSLVMVAVIIFLSSFKNVDGFIGKYGVSASDPAQIKLVINSDHTFYYQDFSVSSKKIVVNGTWTTKRGKVHLKDNRPGNKFHNVWAFADNGQTAKSHKGLTFYRLAKIEE